MNEHKEKEQLELDLDSLKKELHQLRHDFSDVKNTAESLGKDSFLYASDTIKDDLREGLEGLETCMDKHPVCTVAAALSAGVVLGALLGGRRR